jgi:hypothetical protein
MAILLMFLTGNGISHHAKHAKIRISVKHSIAGMKSFHGLMHRIRNHSPLLIDNLFCLSAGLWNFKIQ